MIGWFIIALAYDAGEDVGEIGVWVDAVQLAAFDEAGDCGPVFCAEIVSGEERIFAPDGHHPFILPMSGMNWTFNIAGIPILAGRSGYGE